jgi:hypothetical protein
MPPNLRISPFAAGARNATAVDFTASPRLGASGFDVPRHDMAAGSVRQGYNRFCDNVSAKIWDEPNGRRLSFDSRGKPGLAVEIPLH